MADCLALLMTSKDAFQITPWLYQTASMFITAVLLPGFRVGGPVAAFFVVLALYWVNSYLWDPALFYEIPTSLSSRTFLLIGANGLLFWLMIKLLPGTEIEGVLPALAGPLVYCVVLSMVNEFAPSIDWTAVGHATARGIAGIRSYFR